MGSAFSSAGRVKAPAMRRDAAMASATSLGWVLSPAVKAAARARISSSVIEMVAPMLRGLACRKSGASGTLDAAQKWGEVQRPHPRGGIQSTGCCAAFKSRRARWERQNRLENWRRRQDSRERLLFGFDGGDFLDLAAGQYPEEPLERLRGAKFFR